MNSVTPSITKQVSIQTHNNTFLIIQVTMQNTNTLGHEL
jgi:hypothetical protein